MNFKGTFEILTFPRYPTIIGDINPGNTVIIPLIPRTIPAKFGAISTKLARGPDDTAPWAIVAKVMNVTAATALSPKYANPNTKIPFTTQHMNVASFRTFVLLILSVLRR